MMGRCIEWVNGWMARNQGVRGVALLGRFFRCLGAVLTSRTVYGALRFCAGVCMVFAVVAHAKTGRLFYIPAVLVIYVFAFHLLPRLWGPDNPK